MNWMTSELEFDSPSQQKFFFSSRMRSRFHTGSGDNPPVLWVRRNRSPGKKRLCFLSVRGFKNCKGDTDYCNQRADYSYFLMDVKSMIRKRRHIHSCHETVAFHFVKFSVKQTYKERIMENYEFCATALYVNHHLVPEGTEYYYIPV